MRVIDLNESRLNPGNHQWGNSSSRGLPIEHVKRITYQLVTAVSHLHSKGLLHGGLCPDSLIMHESGILKVGGLCYASLIPKVSKGSPLRLPPPMHYMSPELILADVRGLLADIWSIGCICGELATGAPLFPGKSEAKQLRLIAVDVGVSSRSLTILREREDAGKILYGISHHDFDSHFRERYRDLDRSLVDFLSLCLQPESSKRASAEELLKTPFLREAAAECNNAMAEEAERMKALWTDAKGKTLSSSFMSFSMTLKGLNARLLQAADSIAMPLPPELAAPPPPPAPVRPRSPPPLNNNERISPNRISPNGMMMGPPAAKGGLSATGAALFGGPPPAVPWLKRQQSQTLNQAQHALSIASPVMGMALNGQVTSPAYQERHSGPRLAPIALGPRQPRASTENGPPPAGQRHVDESGRIFNEYGDELDPNELPGRISDTRRSKIENWLNSNPPRQHSQNNSSPGNFFESPNMQRSQSNNLSSELDRPPVMRIPSLGANHSLSAGLRNFDAGSDRTSNNVNQYLPQRTSNNGSSSSFVLPPRHSFLPAASNAPYGIDRLSGDRLSGGGRPPSLDLRDGSASRAPTIVPLHPDVYNVAPSLSNLSIARGASACYCAGPLSASTGSQINRLELSAALGAAEDLLRWEREDAHRVYQDDGI